MIAFDIQLFKQRLAETIAYCAPRFSEENIEGSLRTLLDPLPELSPFDPEPVKQFAEIVFRKRVEALEIDGISSPQIPSNFAGGLLLVSYISYSTCDGTSPIESAKFIDECEFPPCDTWIYYGHENPIAKFKYDVFYLVAWIPPKMIDLVDMAIEVNAMQALQWVDNIEVDFTFMSELKAAGFTAT